jgi:hypothetical protein
VRISGYAEILTSELGVPGDQGEKVVEVVGHTAGHATADLHLLGVTHLSFEFSMLSNVIDQHEDAGRGIGRRQEHRRRRQAAKPPSNLHVDQISIGWVGLLADLAPEGTQIGPGRGGKDGHRLEVDVIGRPRENLMRGPIPPLHGSIEVHLYDAGGRGVNERS